MRAVSKRFPSVLLTLRLKCSRFAQNLLFTLFTSCERFYPKPRVVLGKGPHPLRCNPMLVEQVGPQGDDGRAVGPFPTHAPFFHAAVDHQGHGPLDHATPYGIAKLAPVL